MKQLYHFRHGIYGLGILLFIWGLSDRILAVVANPSALPISLLTISGFVFTCWLFLLPLENQD